MSASAIGWLPTPEADSPAGVADRASLG